MADVAERITVRLGPSQVSALDALAAGHGGSRSAALRSLIDAAQPGGPPPPMDRDAVVACLEAHARAGSTAAARELLDRLEAREMVARLNAAMK